VIAGTIVIACSGLALAAATGKLRFVNTKVDGSGGVDGIGTTYHVATSPDGRNVYATGTGDKAVATFKRDRRGKLHFVNTKVDGVDGVDGLEGASDVVVSSDGRSVYVTGNYENAVATFRRNRRTGKLHFVNAKFDGQGGVSGLNAPHVMAISGDNRSLYVAGYLGNSVATFKRDRRGKLHFVNAKVDGAGGVEGIDAPFGLAVSPDDRNVYATGEGDNAIATFKRNRRNGKLRFVRAQVDGTGGIHDMQSPDQVSLSPNGRNAYVATDGSSSLLTFRRDGHGKLHFVNGKVDDQGGVDGLEESYSVVVSADGRSVYGAGYAESGLATFKRSRRSGKLRFVNAKFDGVDGVTDAGGMWRLALSPDDRNVYAAAYDDSAVVTFKRHR